MTGENRSLLGKGIHAITRLPETFTACGKLINKAVASCAWQEVEQLPHRRVKGKEICAPYRLIALIFSTVKLIR